MSRKKIESEKREFKRMKPPWDKQSGKREDKAVGLLVLLHLIMPKRFLRRGKRIKEGKGGTGRGRGREEAACTHKSKS